MLPANMVGWNMEAIVILSVNVQPAGLLPRYASYEYSHKYNVFCFDACLLYFVYWACWENIELEYRVTEVGRESDLVVINCSAWLVFEKSTKYYFVKIEQSCSAYANIRSQK